MAPWGGAGTHLTQLCPLSYQDNGRHIAGLSNYLRGKPSQVGPGSSTKVIETSSGDWGPEAPPLPRETLLGLQCLLVAGVRNCSLGSATWECGSTTFWQGPGTPPWGEQSTPRPSDASS